MADIAYQKILTVMRKKLLTMQKAIIEQQKEARESISGPERRQEGFDVPFQGDSADVHVSRINSHKILIRQIDNALQAIDKYTYGICQGCQKPITLARLVIIPFATKCTDCQNKEEQSKST